MNCNDSCEVKLTPLNESMPSASVPSQADSQQLSELAERQLGVVLSG